MKTATKLKLATRINSILPTVNNDILIALESISKIDGITSVDLNYPEHFEKHSLQEIQTTLSNTGLEVNGLALRFRSQFVNGELGNKDSSISLEAFQLCQEAADICRSLGGKVLTIWLGYDGFDYPFQVNYLESWNQVKEYFCNLADYAPDLKISIEYKPFQPRAYSLVDSVGVTLLMVNEIGRPNVGVTLDYCHMLMKHENPGFGLNLAAKQNKLYGVHINDGYGLNDDGLMVGTASFLQTLEFVYYLRKFNYQDAIYFDTFPVRENPYEEIKQNIKLISKIFDLVEQIGLERIEQIIEKNDGVAATHLLLECLK
jgi:xylose isomerase